MKKYLFIILIFAAIPTFGQTEKGNFIIRDEFFSSVNGLIDPVGLFQPSVTANPYFGYFVGDNILLGFSPEWGVFHSRFLNRSSYLTLQIEYLQYFSNWKLKPFLKLRLSTNTFKSRGESTSALFVTSNIGVSYFFSGNTSFDLFSSFDTWERSDFSINGSPSTRAPRFNIGLSYYVPAGSFKYRERILAIDYLKRSTMRINVEGSYGVSDFMESKLRSSNLVGGFEYLFLDNWRISGEIDFEKRTNTSPIDFIDQTVYAVKTKGNYFFSTGVKNIMANIGFGLKLEESYLDASTSFLQSEQKTKTNGLIFEGGISAFLKSQRIDLGAEISINKTKEVNPFLEFTSNSFFLVELNLAYEKFLTQHLSMEIHITANSPNKSSIALLSSFVEEPKGFLSYGIGANWYLR